MCFILNKLKYLEVSVCSSLWLLLSLSSSVLDDFLGVVWYDELSLEGWYFKSAKCSSPLTV